MRIRSRRVLVVGPNCRRQLHSDQLLVVRRLVAQGSAIEKPAPYKCRTALHIACREDNDVIVQHLIEEGANVMARDEELETPLHLALADRRASYLVGVSELCSGYSSAIPTAIRIDDGLEVTRIDEKLEIHFETGEDIERLRDEAVSDLAISGLLEEKTLQVETH